MKKKIIFLILFLFLQNCGYSPILSGYKDQKINFNIVEIKGNDDLNKIIKIKMKKFSSNPNSKTINVKITTNLIKNILSKNKKGEVTSYSLFTYVQFEIIDPIKPKIFTFQENTKTIKIDNEFELKRYENTIKTNFVIKKIEELIFNLSTN